MHLAALAAALAVTGMAPATAQSRPLQDRPWLSVSDSGTTSADPVTGRSSFSRLEDPPSDPSGLPAARENLELVGELNPQQFGGVRIGEIADVAVHEGHAYLNSWDSTDCDRGGVYVVDIRNPAQPKEVAYIPPKQPFYHGEGAQAISVDVPGFQGDLLAVNNETWGSNVSNTCGPADTSGGGFDLYDVSTPSDPKTIVQAAGDRDGGDGPLDEQETANANSYHSVFVWQAGARVYLAAADNVESEDVDIFDITDTLGDPGQRPVQVADLDLAALFPEILDDERANGNAVFNHDMVVKNIDGRQVMSVSYWDAGYVQLDVSDPANPTRITDTTTAADPFRPSLFAEGNAHYSEFSADNQFLLAADEDFAPFRSVLTANGRSRSAIEGGDNPVRIADLPDNKLNGPSTFVGDACAPASIPAPPAADNDPTTDRIALVERGGCGFADKFDSVAAAGYDGIVIFNQPRPDDGQVNMITADDDGPPTIPGVQMRRADALGPDGALTTSTATPAPGTAGPAVSIGIVFDGWGYAHLYDARTSERIDSWAVAESQDPRFASDFGDLSIHEFATDPTEPVAYAAYYGAGMRVVRFSREDGIVETGKFIDDDGNGSNFWGVEVFTGSDGERYIAGADRDFGLQIFRYTGPGAHEKPVCEDQTVETQFQTAIEITLPCTDANGNVLGFDFSQPRSGSVTPVAYGTLRYTPRRGFSGTDRFTVRASDPTSSSGEATVRVKVLSRAQSPYYYVQKRQPRITAKARPKRDPKKPFIFKVDGRLVLPSGVGRNEACKGTVRILAKKRGQVVAKRRTGIKSTCKYKARVKLRKSAGKRGKVVFQVQFLGNDRLLPASARTSARFGKKRR
jgi:hypothetical protein